MQGADVLGLGEGGVAGGGDDTDAGGADGLDVLRPAVDDRDVVAVLGLRRPAGWGAVRLSASLGQRRPVEGVVGRRMASSSGPSQGGDSYEVGADVQAHGAAADEADAQGGHAALGGGHVVKFTVVRRRPFVGSNRAVIASCLGVHHVARWLGGRALSPHALRRTNTSGVC